MKENLIQSARVYAAQHRLELGEQLGFGIHGTVLVVEDNSKPGKTAIKVHRSPSLTRGNATFTSG